MDDRLLPHDITTGRLLLRVPVPEDALELFNSYAQDPEVVRYLTWKPSKTPIDSKRHIEDRILAWRRGNICAWSIIQSEHDRFIGMIELRIKGAVANVGYVLARAMWGNGYATEALNAVICEGLTLPQIDRVTGLCDVENIASIRVMEKAGMVQEGVLHRYVVHPNISREPRDVYSFAITK